MEPNGGPTKTTHAQFLIFVFVLRPFSFKGQALAPREFLRDSILADSRAKYFCLVLENIIVN